MCKSDENEVPERLGPLPGSKTNENNRESRKVGGIGSQASPIRKDKEKYKRNRIRLSRHSPVCNIRACWDCALGPISLRHQDPGLGPGQFVPARPLAGWVVSWTPTWLDPELTGPPGASTAVVPRRWVGAGGVLGCWWGTNKRIASGYKNPPSAGGCWPAAPPLRGPVGVTRRGQPLGVALQELKSSAAWGHPYS